MHRLRVIAFAALSALPALVAQPDVIVGSLNGAGNYGTDGTFSAYSIGTTSCNIGSQNLDWIASNNLHPVIAQNLYRLMNGRFLHVGQSWLKHGFAVAAGNLCGTCTNFSSTVLAVGCSDPYGSGLNGQQSNLGPRSQVNPSTGVFPYPFTAPGFAGNVARRLKVRNSDIPASGATWIAEAQYIHQQDAGANVDDNNTSYRMATLSGGNLGLTGSTFQQLTAIEGWAALDPTVTLQNVQVPGPDGGRLILASKVTGGPGAWHFEYALYNQNCHDSVASLSVTFPNGTTISNTGFYAPESHSGEPYDNNPWIASVGSNGVSFAVDQPFISNPNSNAIRWGTMYSFWFDASAQPTGAAIGLYRSNCTFNVGGPSCVTPPWQVNQAGSSFDVDGLTNGPYSGPILANLGVNEAHSVNVSGTAGQAYQWFATLSPGVANLFTTPNGQKVNIDFTHPTFAALWGPTLPTMPGGGLTFPLNTPNATIDISIQQLVFDPAAADGFWLSALNEIHIAPCLTNVQPLSLGDDTTVNVAIGPGSAHPCAAPITFAGTTYSSVYVNSNGSVSFGQGSTDFTATTGEFTSLMPRLAGLWMDLNPGVGGSITASSVTSGLLTVSFQGVPQFGLGTVLSSFDLVFDTMSGSCAIQNFNPGAVTNNTIVGLTPGGGAGSIAVNFGALAGAGVQAGNPAAAVYQYTAGGAPGGFTSVTFPNGNGGSFIVN